MAKAKELTCEDAQRIKRTIYEKCESVREAAVTGSRCTIFRVPAHICRGREDLFRPHMLSVGPYHRGKQELQEMEKVKLQFLLEISERIPVFLETCFERLKDLEEMARACYYHEVHLDRDEFIEMLLLDGCFIIQLFIKWKKEGIRNTFLESRWNSGMISHDLLLLENQIPFFVLREIFHLMSVNVIYNPLNEIAMDFLMPSGFMSRPRNPPSKVNDIHHLLHLFYSCHIDRPAAVSNSQRGTDHSHFMCGVIPNPMRRRVFSLIYSQATTARPPPETPVKIIPSATRLVEAGVTFRKKRTDNFLDIDFRSGTLEIPYISISESAIHRLANLLALEQCVNVGKEITSYAAFMDCLIDTSDDMAILRRKGILGKMMSNNKEVADFFNQLCAYSLLDYHRHHLVKVFKEVDDYCRSSRHENRAKLVRDYFSSPWASISLVAAMVLLSLTFLQTFISFYSYYHNPSS